MYMHANKQRANKKNKQEKNSSLFQFDLLYAS